jgi:hypothetical protein
MSVRDIACYGGLPDGSDTTPAWNAALASGVSGVAFSAGRYTFLTPPNPITRDGVQVVGCSPWTTHLSRAYTPPTLSEPFLHVEGRGSRIENLCIEAALGTSGGYGLRFLATNATLPGGKHHVRHVRISGQLGADGLHHATWRVPLHIQGDQRTIAPIGIRGVKLYDVEVFDGEQWLAVFWGAIVCVWYGGSAAQGGGKAKGIAVGGAMAQKNRIDADIDWLSSSIVPGTMRGPGW